MADVSPEAVLQFGELELARGRRRLATDLNLALMPGETALVVGGNGSGKTTLAWVLLGLLPPAGGTLHTPARIGFAPQDPLFPLEGKVASYFHQLCALQGMKRTEARAATARALEMFQLTAMAMQTIGTLSRGWQQRVNLARAWLGHPSLLLLDEAQTALDPEGMQALAHALEQADAPAALLLAPPGVGCEALAPLRLDLSHPEPTT